MKRYISIVYDIYDFRDLVIEARPGGLLELPGDDPPAPPHRAAALDARRADLPHLDVPAAFARGQP